MAPFFWCDPAGYGPAVYRMAGVESVKWLLPVEPVHMLGQGMHALVAEFRVGRKCVKPGEMLNVKVGTIQALHFISRNRKWWAFHLGLVVIDEESAGAT